MDWYQKAKSKSKKLIIMRGVSGSGKSTLARHLGKEYTFSTDDFFMVDGEYDFDPNLIPEAHIWNQERVEKAMKYDVSPIVVDNMNRQFWEMRPYVELAEKYGYEVEFKQPNWSPDLYLPDGKWNIDFLKGKNKHDVPDDSLKKMIDSYEYNPTKEKILKSKMPWEK